MGQTSKGVTRAHALIDQLEARIGPLDHLCFAFPRVLGETSNTYDDPSGYIAGAIAAAHDPPAGVIKGTVGPEHPCPASYVRLNGIAGVEVQVPSNSAKKLLKRKYCLVVEKVGQ